MGKFLGALAGIGMLGFIACLVLRFLCECHLVSAKQILRIRRVSLIVSCVAGIYWLCGGLMYAVVYEPIASLAEINAIFRTSSQERMYELLKSPSFAMPVSGLFAWIAHGIGTVLFGQYLFAGVILALGMTMLGSCLLYSRAEKLWGQSFADQILFLLLAIPGALFLFLPGWQPAVYLCISILFFLLGKRFPERKVSWRGPEYEILLSIFSILSAMVVFASVTALF